MTWATYPDREIAEKVCEPEEIAVLRLKAAGYGRRSGSLALGISEETWRYRMRKAMMKIQKAKQEAA